jgi:DivIVA domain-containing protein
MTVTPADVHNVAFSKPSIAKRGYNAADVDAFLDDVERELIRLIEENNQLHAQVERRSHGGTPARPAVDPRLAAELDDLRAQLDQVQRDRTAAEQTARALRAELEQMRAPGSPVAGGTGQQPLRVLTMAQRMADDHVDDARREADKLLSDARATAEEVIRRARSDADALERDARQHFQEALEGLAANRTAMQTHIEELKDFERRYRTRLKAYLEGQLRDLGGRGGRPEPETSGADRNRPAASPGSTAAPTPSADPGPVVPPRGGP